MNIQLLNILTVLHRTENEFDPCFGEFDPCFGEVEHSLDEVEHSLDDIEQDLAQLCLSSERIRSFFSQIHHLLPKN